MVVVDFRAAVRAWVRRLGRVPRLLLAVVLGLPVTVHAGTIAGGADHSIAIKDDGTVWTFGDNTDGELGIDTSGAGTGSLIPVQVPGLTGIVAVAAGQNFSVALDESGHVFTWGDNAAGRLGDGTTVDRDTPYQVSIADVTAIAAGQAFVLALKDDGTVWGWGTNQSGQLGDDTFTTRKTPIQVKDSDGVGPLDSVLSIAAGGTHSLAVKASGSVYAWGRNNVGQLGVNDLTNRDLPTPVLGVGGSGTLGGAASAAGGVQVSYVLLTTGVVVSFGHNNSGQLGNNTTVTQSLVPVQVVSSSGSGVLTGVTHFAAGDAHALAIVGNGLWAWGSGSNGRLGVTTTTVKRFPVQVKDNPGTGFLLNVVAVDGGMSHSLAVQSGAPGTAWGWGLNTSGRLGDSTVTQRVRPQQVNGSGFVWGAVAPTFTPVAGLYNTVQAVSIDSVTPGATIRYTLNTTGGIPPDPGPSDAELLSGQTVPITVTTTIKAKAWADALVPSGVSQATYTLKVVAPSPSPDPGTYSPPLSVSFTTTTGGASIYYTNNGTDPTIGSTPYTGPISVGTTTTLKAKAFKQDWSDSDTTTATYTITSGPVPPPGISPASGTHTSLAQVSLSSISGATIRFTMDGVDPDLTNSFVYSVPFDVDVSLTVKARAWHPDYQPSGTAWASYSIKSAKPVANPDGGTFDNPTTAPASTTTPGAIVRYTTNGVDPVLGDTPLPAAGLYIDRSLTLKTRAFKLGTLDSDVETSDFTINKAVISGGTNHSVLARSDGAAWSWGLYGSTLGNGSSLALSQPAAALPVGVRSVAAGLDHTLFLLADGSVKACGANFYGQLGNGDSGGGSVTQLTPITVMANSVTPLAGIAEIAVGEHFSMALGTDGRVWAWGTNVNGRLGDGSGQLQAYPVLVMTGARAIAAGKTFALAADAQGRVWAWGSNLSGQVGDGTKGNDRPSPVVVGGLSGVTGLAAGSQHSVALRNDGTVWAWGDNVGGQVGDGTQSSRTTPVQVSGLSQVIAISASSATHSLALRADGTLWSWGYSSYYVHGDGVLTPRYVPKAVPGLANVVAIAAAPTQSLAVTSDHAVWAWGLNWTLWGQLGDGSNAPFRRTPIRVLDAAFTPKAATPNVSPEGAQWGPTGSPTSVTVSGVQGTEIHYALNEAGDPDQADPLAVYQGTAIPISGTTTLKAMSWQSGRNPSNVALEIYTAKLNLVTFTPGPTQYASAQSVSMSSASAPAGTEIWFTTNGSEPVRGAPSIQFTGTPINVASTTSFKARAFHNIYTTGDLSLATYTIVYGTVSTPVATPAGNSYSGTQIVSLSSNGDQIYYTFDWSEPAPGAPGSFLYSGPISVDRTTFLQARAYRANWNPSAIMPEFYTINGSNTVATPTASVNTGTYNNELLSVTLDCPTAGAQIRYTTNGLTPYPYQSSLYTAGQPLQITKTTTLLVRAFLPGWTDSATLSRIYTLALLAPTLNPPNGTPGPLSVTVTAPVAGSTMHYTLNGVDPDQYDEVVASGGQVAVAQTSTLKVKAWREGWTTSPAAIGTYTLAPGIVDVPRFWPAAATYTTAQNVVIWSTTPEATVRYTTDGSDPTWRSPVVRGKLLVAEGMTVKARAFKAGMTASATIPSAYTINLASVAAPVLSLPSGAYPIERDLYVSSATPGAVLHCNQDGPDPTELDNVCDENAVIVDEPQIVKVRAFKNGMTPSPVVRAIYNITGAVAAGYQLSMAVHRYAELFAWGTGYLGGAESATTPVSLVESFEYVSAASVSPKGPPGHILALNGVTNQVMGWGANDVGQATGVAGPTVTTPTLVGGTGVYDVIAISAGDSHSLALKADGTVWSWGGYGSSLSQVQASGGPLQNVIAIAAGTYHSAALKSDGTVWSWGRGTEGQLGTGSLNDSSFAVQATGLSGVSAIAVATYTTFGLKTDGGSKGTLYGWGASYQGALGNGLLGAQDMFFTDLQPTPRPIGTLPQLVDVTGSPAMIAAREPDGSGGYVIWAWGTNSGGGLGDGTLSNRFVPVRSRFDSARGLAVGSGHMLSRSPDGSVWSWGPGANGQLGNGGTSQSLTPVQVSNFHLGVFPSWFTGDADSDGLSNDREWELGSDPEDPDSNDDGVSDGQAGESDLSVTEFDQDHDGLINAIEVELGTDPFLGDTDGDSVLDGADAFPLDPTRSTPPGPTGGDVTPPAITLTEPPGAQLISSTP